MKELDLSLLQRVAVECPGFQARATARALTRFYNACFKPLELTAEQFSLLVGIGAAQEPTVVDLAESAGVDATTLSRSVQALQRRGLVGAEGGRGPAGKRLSLTPAGVALMAQALPVWERAKTSLSHRLGEATLQATRQAMMDLADAAAEADAALP
ncbi:MarR family winged helix-turn-helix transcriptional regulator [Undibacterium sp.]|uniref:MarR family winged helix-turn-helix transcriptional regulator n=1 Tax=Undibacterium sp. TaxID=1914977 RepID=UPI00374DE5B3